MAPFAPSTPLHLVGSCTYPSQMRILHTADNDSEAITHSLTLHTAVRAYYTTLIIKR